MYLYILLAAEGHRHQVKKAFRTKTMRSNAVKLKRCSFLILFFTLNTFYKQTQNFLFVCVCVYVCMYISKAS